MTDSYKTIKKPSKGSFKVKKSKFYAFAYPVYTEDDIKKILAKLRKEYYDARHHCYAYRLGVEKTVFRANDDGEPSYSSGKPILGQIESYDLTNILIVVIRYFGGILLGVGGLATAYRTAAMDALKNAEIITKTVDSIIDIRFEYKDMNSVMKIIKSSHAEIIKQKFDLECYISLSVRLTEVKSLIALLKNIDSLTLVVGC